MSDPCVSQLVAIRKANSEDVDQVCELLFGLKKMYASCTETTAEDFGVHFAPAVRAALASPSNAVWVADAGKGVLAGTLSTTHRLVIRLGDRVGVLEEVFVRPAYRRRGIAMELWRSASDELRASGVRTVEVVTSLAHPGQRQFANRLGLEWYASIHRVQL